MKEKLQSAKMSANRLLSLLLVAVMVLAMLPAIDFPAAAATEGWTEIGTCEWQLTGEENVKTLTIRPIDSGTSGILPDDYTNADSWPWYSDRNQITKVVIEEGVKAGNSTKYLFNGANLTTIEGLVNLNTSSVTTMKYMFYNCQKLESLDLSGFNTSSVTNMGYMFQNCKKLKTLDFSGFDTSKVKIMICMFYNCQKLESLDLSGFNTSSITDMGYMFNGCNTLKSLDLSGFDTSKVTKMSNMFNGCSVLETLDLSGFDTSSVTDMSYMFCSCNTLKSLDLSGFDTSKVTKMSYMFNGCSVLETLDLSGFDTSSVTDMSNMFNGCSVLETLDLSGFDTSSVENMKKMFCKCTNLTTILVGNGWNAVNNSELTSSTSMFASCSSLVGGAGTTVNTTVDKTYARVDGGDSAPGYLTSPEQYFADKPIILKDGKAYSTEAKGCYGIYEAIYTLEDDCINATAAVASKGLKYVPEVPADVTKDIAAVPAHWEMNNFTFETSAPLAVIFVDNGTEGDNAKINLSVSGSNSITGKETSEVALSGLYFDGDYTDVVISGSGENPVLDVKTGKMNGESAQAVALWASGNLTITDLTANFTTGEAVESELGQPCSALCAGILVSNSFTVDDGAMVTTTAKKCSYGMGTEVDGKLTVMGTGKLIAKCEDPYFSEDSGSTDIWPEAAVKCLGGEPYAKAVTGSEPAIEPDWDDDEYTYVYSGSYVTDVTLTAHPHTWDYSASGATLTATCTCTKVCEYAKLGKDDDGRKLSLTLTASDKDYTGAEYAGAGLGDTSAWEEAGLSVPTIKYLGRDTTDYSESETAPTNVGTYTARITIGEGEKAAIATANFTINPQNLTVTPDADQSKTYDGKTASGITYQFSGQVGSEVPGFSGALALKDSAVNVGSYDIVVNDLALTDNDSFKAANYTLKFTENVKYTIFAQALTESMIGNINDQTYTSGEIKPELTIKDGDVTLKENTDYTVEYTNNVQVGTATVTVKGKGNYNGTISKTFNILPPCYVKITKVDPTTVQHLDKITVTADANIPEGCKLVWEIGGTAKGEIVETSDDGNTVTVVAESSGTLEITAKVVSKEDGSTQVSDTAKVTVEKKYNNILDTLMRIFMKVFINIKFLLGK